MLSTIILTFLIFVAAMLYSSVGHAGASGYLAAMGLFRLPQVVMKPAALVLNIFVASIGTFRFWRAGHLSLRLLWPFIVLSIPFAFFGGRMQVGEVFYKRLLGGVLLYAAGSMLWQTLRDRRAGTDSGSLLRPPPIPVALLVGGGLGLLSGVTGVGGGIFLSPVLILMRWADTKRTAAASAAFILVNSIAGLAGQIFSGQFKPFQTLPWEFLVWAVAAVMGGAIGSHLGARKLNYAGLRIMLALVLVIGGVNLLLTRKHEPAAPAPSATSTQSVDQSSRTANPQSS